MKFAFEYCGYTESFWEKLWTDPVAFCTLGLVIVALFQGYLLCKQIRHARTEFITTKRAFVFLKDFEYDIRNTNRNDPCFVTLFVLKPIWQNNGYTHTKEMTISIGLDYFQNGILSSFPYDYNIIKNCPMFLGPQSSQLSERIEIPSGTVAKVINNGIGNNGDIFIWGRADYKDTISCAPHFIEWCYRIALSFKDNAFLVSFIQSQAHNRTDNIDEPNWLNKLWRRCR